MFQAMCLLSDHGNVGESVIVRVSHARKKGIIGKLVVELEDRLQSQVAKVATKTLISLTFQLFWAKCS